MKFSQSNEIWEDSFKDFWKKEDSSPAIAPINYIRSRINAPTCDNKDKD